MVALVNKDETVYRAILPQKRFIKKNGTISPAAFKDPKGLSVDIGDGREDLIVAQDMLTRLNGIIVKIHKVTCDTHSIEIKRKPTKNIYHCLLINTKRANDEDLILTHEQALSLSKECIKVT